MPASTNGYYYADDVINPCPVYTALSALPPIWNISGNYYNYKSLPKEYKPAYIGIIIPTSRNDYSNVGWFVGWLVSLYTVPYIEI